MFLSRLSSTILVVAVVAGALVQLGGGDNDSANTTRELLKDLNLHAQGKPFSFSIPVDREGNPSTDTIRVTMDNREHKPILLGETAKAARLQTKAWFFEESFHQRLSSLGRASDEKLVGLDDGDKKGDGQSVLNQKDVFQVNLGKNPYVQSMVSGAPLETFSMESFEEFRMPGAPYLFVSSENDHTYYRFEGKILKAQQQAQLDVQQVDPKTTTTTKKTSTGRGAGLRGLSVSQFAGNNEESDSAGGGTTGKKGFKTGGTTHVVRYACCDGILLRHNPSADSEFSIIPKRNEEVWVTDILPTTGLNSAFNDMEEDNEECDASNAAHCRDFVSDLSQSDTAIQYYAEVYRPTTEEVGYVHIQSLFRRPVRDENDSVVLEAGYKKIAKELAVAIRDSVVEPPECSDPSWTVTLSAGAQPRIYHPTSQSSTNCNVYTGCEPWILLSCEENEDYEESCFYESASECGQEEIPDRDPSQSLFSCMKNTCMYKATCLTCMTWFQQTGQDKSGWQSTAELAHQCEMELMQQYGVDPVVGWGDENPFECWGYPTCYAYCAAQVTEHFDDEDSVANPSSCQNYIHSHHQRTYPDKKDYECGELPIGATHANMWKNTDTGEWVGSLNFNKKRLMKQDVLGEWVEIMMDRLPGQKSFSRLRRNLTSKSTKEVSYSKELKLDNFWIAFDREDSTAFDDEEKDLLWTKLCVDIPGMTISGPNVDYKDGLTIPVKGGGTTNIPSSLIRGINFGKFTFDSLDVCILGGFWLDQELEPRLELAEIYPRPVNPNGGELDIKFGPGVALAALIMKHFGGPLGNIIATLLLTEVAIVELVEFFFDSDTFLEQIFYDFIYEQFKTRLSAKLVSEFNPKVQEVMSKQSLDLKKNLHQACGKLHPNVSGTSPYFYFYRFMEQQCYRLTELENFIGNDSKNEGQDATEWFERNQASESAGCYGTDDESFLFSAAESNSNAWWTKYEGQSWWAYTDQIPDKGCRLSTRIAAPDLDPAFWLLLKCAVANVNYYHNNGLFWYIEPGQHKDSLAAPDVDAPTHQEMVDDMGELNYMIYQGCQLFGKEALDDLYGDGQDLIDLYKTKHPDDGLGGLQGGN